jgi:flagellar motor switch protein FliG
LSELVDFDDLGALDGTDLRAVLDQVPEPLLLEALAGAPASLRHLLLTRLPSATAGPLEAKINAHAPISLESVRAAQRAVVEVLCRLSRSGQVAFDDPDDMVA